eukprot:TRINITY_DN3356_c0_g1_i2.p4 TRINITY_DN3356_c0_g1~~TRINITY_DN3356_c0_g1_i2.p4  ORF type:complete len:123 (+),score=10.20 TRINITY_DN3356_c0_g1_i2:215-583(+)
MCYELCCRPIYKNGVTGSSLLELQAQFYRGQESVADGSWIEAARKSRRHAGIALFEKKNAGVEQRDAGDKLFVKSADQYWMKAELHWRRKQSYTINLYEEKKTTTRMFMKWIFSPRFTKQIP